jgi:hypothetical protein
MVRLEVLRSFCSAVVVGSSLNVSRKKIQSVTWLIVFRRSVCLNGREATRHIHSVSPLMIFSSETSFTAPPTGSAFFQNLLRCLAPLQKISRIPHGD